MIAALTLLPALLGLLGDRVNPLRIPWIGRTSSSPTQEGRFWGAIVRGVMRRPVVYLRGVRRRCCVAAAVPAVGLQPRRERRQHAAGPARVRSKGYEALDALLPAARARARR